MTRNSRVVVVSPDGTGYQCAGVDVVIVPRDMLIRLSASMFYSLEARENASRKLLELAGVHDDDAEEIDG